MTLKYKRESVRVVWSNNIAVHYRVNMMTCPVLEKKVTDRQHSMVNSEIANAVRSRRGKEKQWRTL